MLVEYVGREIGPSAHSDLRDAPVYKQFDSGDITAVVGCEKHDRLRNLICRADPAERNAVGQVG